MATHEDSNKKKRKCSRVFLDIRIAKMSVSLKGKTHFQITTNENIKNQIFFYTLMTKIGISLRPKCHFPLLTHAPAIEKWSWNWDVLLQSPTNTTFVSFDVKILKLKSILFFRLPCFPLGFRQSFNTRFSSIFPQFLLVSFVFLVFPSFFFHFRHLLVLFSLFFFV